VSCQKNIKSCASASAKTGIPSLTALATAVLSSTTIATVSVYALTTVQFRRQKKLYDYDKTLPEMHEASIKIAEALNALATSTFNILLDKDPNEERIRGLAEFTVKKYLEAEEILDALDGQVSERSINVMERWLRLIPIGVKASRIDNRFGKAAAAFTAYRLNRLAQEPRRIEPPPPENHAISSSVAAGSSVALLSSAIAAAYLHRKKQAYQSKSLEHKKARRFWVGVVHGGGGQAGNDFKQVTTQQLMAFYDDQEFNAEAARRLTEKFSGSRLSEEKLKRSLISLHQPSHIVRIDQNGAFLLNSPNGHIYYARFDDGVVQIKVVIPRRGHEAELTRILASIAPKTPSRRHSPSKE
jgi:hypothetical protein